MSYTSPYLLLHYETGYSVHSIVNGEMTLVSSTQSSAALTADVTVVNVYLTFILIFQDMIYVVQAEVSTNPTCNGILINVTRVQDDESSINCIDDLLPFVLSAVHEGDIAVVGNSTDGIISGFLAISASYMHIDQAKPTIFGSVFSYNTANGVLTSQNPVSYFDFGSAPSIKLMEVNGELFLLEV